MTLKPGTYPAGHEEAERYWNRRAYLVVDQFEQELCDFTGAPFVVAVNSCTNAIQLALMWERMNGVAGPVELPRRTYLGVLQAVLRAGFDVQWNDRVVHKNWQDWGNYVLMPTWVADYARSINQGMYESPEVQCLSFHVAKQLPIGRGGAILTDNEEAAEWFRAARMDGRAPGDPGPPIIGDTLHCPMPPDVAARGLDILSRWEGSPTPLPHTSYPDLSEWYP